MAVDWSWTGVLTTPVPGTVAVQVTLHDGAAETVIDPLWVQVTPSTVADMLHEYVPALAQVWAGFWAVEWAEPSPKFQS